jgi:hypothetical protein
MAQCAAADARFSVGSGWLRGMRSTIIPPQYDHSHAEHQQSEQQKHPHQSGHTASYEQGKAVGQYANAVRSIQGDG